MPTENSVATASGILNKGRALPKRGTSSTTEAEAVLTKSLQPSATPNPTVNFASEFPSTNTPEITIQITDLVHLFETVLDTGAAVPVDTDVVFDGGSP